MKVIFILPGYSNKPIGGFKIIYQYANFLVRNQIDVTIIHPYILASEPIYNGFVGKIRFFVKRVLWWLHIKRVKRSNWFSVDDSVKMLFVDELNESTVPSADVIVATKSTTAFKVNELAKKHGKKFYFIQGFENWANSDSLVLNSWKLPLELITVSKWLKQKVEKVTNKKSYHVPNFISHQDFYVTNPIDERDNIISMMYNKETNKGSIEGLKAFQSLHAFYGDDIHFILFGVSERPKNLPEYIEYYMQPNASTLRDSILNRSSIYLMPSHSEGWGLTATEAMACGNALVTTDNGGVNDFAFDGITALIVPVQDVEAMVSKIASLLEDKKKRISLAIEGEKVVQQYTIEKSGNKLLNVFRG